MVTEKSDIPRYFSGSTVFITGATGLVGKLLIEKLLRTCSGITKIYLLIRGKKEKTPQERFQKLLDAVIFEPFKKEHPKLLEKLVVVEGNCALPGLGLGYEIKQNLINEVNCVFHCAADIRFNQTIRDAAFSNVRGTRDLLAMAKQMQNLTAFIYVSTSYSHCVKSEIGEEIYDPPITGKSLLTLVDCLDNKMLEKITPTLIGDWPNTYVFTKSVTEEVVGTEGQGLPLAIVRPSIITATVKEPIPGWIDNLYGATGMFIGGGLGIIHTLHSEKNARADLIPADVVVNCVIAAAWNVGKVKKVESKSFVLQEDEQFQNNDKTNMAVYNCVGSINNSNTWKGILDLLGNTYLPIMFMVWYPFSVLTRHYWLYSLCVLLLHQVPAYIIDFACYCIGKPRRVVKIYKKVHELSTALSYFTCREWRFRNTNTRQLWSNLSGEDQKNFYFDMDALDWQDYFYKYVIGIRTYILKDPLETVPQARKKYALMAIAHYTLVGLLLFGLFKILMVVWSTIV